VANPSVEAKERANPHAIRRAIPHETSPGHCCWEGWAKRVVTPVLVPRRASGHDGAHGEGKQRLRHDESGWG
jgi:hypothetical protein